MTCSCKPKWLTTVSEPVSAEAVVREPCPCCGAGIGNRCGAAGWLDKDHGRAWVDVCPARLQVQQLTLAPPTDGEPMRQAA